MTEHDSSCHVVVRRALRLIHSKSQPARTIREVQALLSVGISESHFRRLFSRDMGESPGRYLRRLRMKRVRKLLVSEPELTLDEVAEKVGFSCASALAISFKREHGITPGQYRVSKCSEPEV